jgi:flagellar motor switch protein FliN
MIDPHKSAVNLVAELLSEAFAEAASWKLKRTPVERIPAPEPGDENRRWLQQTFTGLPGLELYAGIPPEAEPLVDDAALPAAFSALAQKLSSALGVDVSALELAENQAPADAKISWVQVGGVDGYQLGLPESASQSLEQALESRLSSRPAVPQPKAAGGRALDALMDVEMPVSVSFGSVEMPLGEVLKLTTGSIVEFQHPLNAPVNVIVNNCVVARGDVVDVDGHYGVRVSEIVASGSLA